MVQKEQGLEPPDGGLWDWVLGRLDESVARLGARTAGEAMSAPAIVIEAGSTVAEAARLMTTQQVNRLPVVRDGELVGIVTRADLVRAFHRPDEEIRREIDTEVLGALWVDPSRLRLEVDEGRVSLKGRVESRSEAELIAAHVRPIPGVIEVCSARKGAARAESPRQGRQA